MHDSIAASAIPKEEGAFGCSLPNPATKRQGVCPKARGPGQSAGAAAGRKRRSLQRAGRDNAIVWPPAAAPARAGLMSGVLAARQRACSPLPARTHRAATPPLLPEEIWPESQTSWLPASFSLRARQPPARPGFCFPLRRSAGISLALIPRCSGLGCGVPGLTGAGDLVMAKVSAVPGRTGDDVRAMGEGI